MEKAVYYYDRIEVCFIDMDKDAVTKCLPIAELKKYSKLCDITRTKKIGYKARMSLIAPTTEALEILHTYDVERHKIFNIELAKDTMQESEEQAIEAVTEQVLKMRRKYTSTINHFSQFEKNIYTDVDFDPEKFGHETGYFGSQRFRFVVYARMSKVTGDPCLHEEFRIKWASTIKQLMGIERIDQLLTYDIKEFWENRYDRLFIHGEEIDHLKLGKWMLGWGRRKKFSKREVFHIKCMASAITRTSGNTYSGLVQYLSAQKKAAKKSGGRRTDWQQKILRLNNYGKFKALVP